MNFEPFLKYPGGKSKEIPLVNRYKPDVINRYFEPFVGGASIYLNLDVKNSFINDFSSDLYNFYFFVKTQNEKFHNILNQLDALWHEIENNKFDETLFERKKYLLYYEKALKRKNSTLEKFEEQNILISDEDKKRTELTARKTSVYMLVRDAYNKKQESVEHITAYFYFLREYCYSSMFRFSKNGDFNVPYGGRSYDYKYMTKKINVFFSNDCGKYFENTHIYNLDFESFLNQFEFNENDFIFLDPPYDSNFSTYDNNVFDKKEQVRLRDVLTNVQAKWLMIIKRTDFIYDLYRDFHIFEYDKNYLVSFKNRNNKDVTHLLITNYEIEDNNNG